jgi:4-hydroxy-2-oxoheptanedioate aldolase
MCQAYKAKSIAPIVRITKPDPYEATKALYTGASAVVAPYVETVDEVEQLRAAVKLRPIKGRMLREMLSGSRKPQEGLAGYLEKYNEGKALIVNIESVPAIEALDDILAVPGLDGLLIGPHDLSCSLGVPKQYDHPLVIEAVQQIIGKARAKNIGVGVHNWPSAEGEIELAKAGLNLILHFSDMTLFRNALFRNLGRIRKALGDKVVSRPGEQAI